MKKTNQKMGVASDRPTGNGTHLRFLAGREAVLDEKSRGMKLVNQWVKTLPEVDQKCVYALLCV